jgi:hypothetical protein
MIHAKPFFGLQLKFASRVVLRSATSLADTLLDYINLYARFGLGSDFDAANPRWQEFLSGLDRVWKTRNTPAYSLSATRWSRATFRVSA